MKKSNVTGLFISVFLSALILCAWAQPGITVCAENSSRPQKSCAPEFKDCLPDGFIEDKYPRISAVLSSPCGVAIDISSITMTLNNFPLTPSITGAGPEVTVSFVLDAREKGLAEETPHSVTISCSDTNGEKGEKTWEFFIPILY